MTRLPVFGGKQRKEDSESDAELDRKQVESRETKARAKGDKKIVLFYDIPALSFVNCDLAICAQGSTKRTINSGCCQIQFIVENPKKLNIFLSLSTFVRIKKETSIHFPDLARKLDRTFQNFLKSAQNNSFAMAPLL